MVGGQRQAPAPAPLPQESDRYPLHRTGLVARLDGAGKFRPHRGSNRDSLLSWHLLGQVRNIKLSGQYVPDSKIPYAHEYQFYS